jgi:hypothetical protein
VGREHSPRRYRAGRSGYGAASNLNKNIYEKIEAWRTRPIVVEHSYFYLNGIVLKRSCAGEVRNVSLGGHCRGGGLSSIASFDTAIVASSIMPGARQVGAS